MNAHVTIGVLGQPWRGAVTSRGAIEWGAAERLDWWVAADDRWHDPQHETSLRQTRLDGVPVVETRVRVPQGDVVQRVFAVADGGGVTVVEFENDSPLPVAVALSRRDILSSRPPSDTVPQGIELPAGAVVLPVGHRATVRVGIAHAEPRSGPLPADLPTALAVVRGWTSQLERASRVVLPEPAMVAAMLGARAAVALEGLDDPEDDPVGFLLGIHEMVRLGADPDRWMVEVAVATERVARRAAQRGVAWDDDRALLAAASVFESTHDHRAAADTAAARGRLGPRVSRALADPGGVRTVAWVEDRLARPVDVDEARLLPDGFPPTWRGAPIEGYRLPVAPCHQVSYAVRWHGERPALLWEVSGPLAVPLRLRGPDGSWSSFDAVGETLLNPP